MIYLVIGGTGCYEDVVEWSVCYYHTEKQAHDFVEKINDICLSLTNEGYNDYRDEEKLGVKEKVEQVLALDPKFQMDYTGSDYRYEKVEEGK